MKTCVVILTYIVLVGVCLRARAQSDGQDPNEGERAVDAIDASVHVEVDGHPHQPGSAESSRGQLIRLGNGKQPPATTFWASPSNPAAMGGYDKAQSSALGRFAFLPGTQPGVPAPWQSPALIKVTITKSDGSSQAGSRLWKSTPAHPRPGFSMPSLNLRTTLPTDSSPDRTPGFDSPFGRSPVEAASTSPFSKTAVPRRKDHTTTQTVCAEMRARRGHGLCWRTGRPARIPWGEPRKYVERRDSLQHLAGTLTDFSSRLCR